MSVGRNPYGSGQNKTPVANAGAHGLMDSMGHFYGSVAGQSKPPKKPKPSNEAARWTWQPKPKKPKPPKAKKPKANGGQRRGGSGRTAVGGGSSLGGGMNATVHGGGGHVHTGGGGGGAAAKRRPDPLNQLVASILRAQTTAGNRAINGVNQQLALNQNKGNDLLAQYQGSVQQLADKSRGQTGDLLGLAAQRAQMLQNQDAATAGMLQSMFQPNAVVAGSYADQTGLGRAADAAEATRNAWSVGLNGQNQQDFFNRAQAVSGYQNQVWQGDQRSQASQLTNALRAQIADAQAQKPLMRYQLGRQMQSDQLAASLSGAKEQNYAVQSALAAQKADLAERKYQTDAAFKSKSLALREAQLRLNQAKTVLASSGASMSASDKKLITSVFNGTLQRKKQVDKQGNERYVYVWQGATTDPAKAYRLLLPTFGDAVAQRLVQQTLGVNPIIAGGAQNMAGQAGGALAGFF